MAKLLIFVSVLLVTYGNLADSAARSRRSTSSSVEPSNVEPSNVEPSNVVSSKVVSSDAPNDALTIAAEAIAYVDKTVSNIKLAAETNRKEAKKSVVTLKSKAKSNFTVIHDKVFHTQADLVDYIEELQSMGGNCDVKSCTNKLHNLQKNAYKILSLANTRVKVVVDEANGYLANIDAAIESAVSILNKNRTQIEACVADVSTSAKADEAIICVDEVVIKVAKAAKSVPVALKAKVVKNKAAIDALKVDLATFIKEASALDKSTGRLYTQSKECVQKIVASDSCQ